MKFVLYNETFDFNLLVVIGGTRSQALAAFRKKIGSTDTTTHRDSPTVLGTTFSNPSAGTACCIYLKHAPNNASRIGTVAHEALHVAKHVTRVTGANNEEVLAYLIGWVVSQVLKYGKV